MKDRRKCSGHVTLLIDRWQKVRRKLFQEKQKKALFDALEKIKGELMVLGFISLLLTFGQSYIADICIPMKYADSMLPCQKSKSHSPKEHKTHHKGGGKSDHHWRLLLYEHRILSSGAAPKPCKAGYVPLISLNGLHQLHIFIFFLAVFHVISSAMVMLLGRLQIRGWKNWEREIVDEYATVNDPTRFRLTHEISFVKDHTSAWNNNLIVFYTKCFFRQFFWSVRRSDYLTMRHGFISVHLAPGSNFDFQKYIKRSLEDDFKVVVAINPVLWTSAIIYLFINVDGWHAMACLSIMPLVVILAAGTKLQAIIVHMAIEIQRRHAVVQGIPLVQVSDKNFWFGWPNDHLAIVRVVIGIGAQFLTSYITLPLYALVTQMGSTMKRSVFDEQTSKALKKWHQGAKKKQDGKPGPMPPQTLGGSGRIEMANASPLASNKPADAIATMNSPGDGDDFKAGNPDLLTGP